MKISAAVALVGVSALALSACTDTGTTTTTVTETATEQASTETSAAQTTEATRSPAAGNDPVFAAVDAVLAAHPGGIITDIDREDGRVAYDIDVVVGDQVIELEVDDDGNVREEEREGDDDDVAEARAATVTAVEAMRQALAQHDGGVVDEAELDEDDGALSWEVDLDDAGGNDLAEVTVPAR